MVYYFNSVTPKYLLTKVTACYVVADRAHLIVYCFNSPKLMHFLVKVTACYIIVRFISWFIISTLSDRIVY